MAEKDIQEKILLSYSDVFADCENALVYGGKQQIKAEDLVLEMKLPLRRDRF